MDVSGNVLVFMGHISLGVGHRFDTSPYLVCCSLEMGIGLRNIS